MRSVCFTPSARRRDLTVEIHEQHVAPPMGNPNGNVDGHLCRYSPYVDDWNGLWYARKNPRKNEFQSSYPEITIVYSSDLV